MIQFSSSASAGDDLGVGSLPERKSRLQQLSSGVSSAELPLREPSFSFFLLRLHPLLNNPHSILSSSPASSVWVGRKGGGVCGEPLLDTGLRQLILPSISELLAHENLPSTPTHLHSEHAEMNTRLFSSCPKQFSLGSISFTFYRQYEGTQGYDKMKIKFPTISLVLM